MYYDDEAARVAPRRDRAPPGAAAEPQAPARTEPGDASAHDVIEEVPPGAILDLDDPEVRIEAELARQIAFDVGLRQRQVL